MVLDIHAVLREALRGYRLPLRGVHGVTHWARVLENGLRLAERTGADAEVVTLFAILHDARRRGEGADPGHGLRGAELAAGLRGRAFDLGEAAFASLLAACARHEDGLTEGDVTARACWDADRLDLGRVGVRPVPWRLCTQAARDPALLEWAHRRARRWAEPGRVTAEWGLPRARWWEWLWRP